MKKKTVAEIDKEIKGIKKAEIVLDREGTYDDSLRKYIDEYKDNLLKEKERLMKK